MTVRSILIAVAVCLASTALAQDSAADLWKAKCKGCHGEDGKAHTRMGEKEKIPDFTNPEFQQKMTDDKLRDVITNGSKDNEKMKAYKEKLSAAEIDSLVKYIRTLK